MPDSGRGFYTHSSKAVLEIAMALCAIKKAFPDHAESLIRDYVMNNPVYEPFWQEAEAACGPLLPDGLKKDVL